MREPEVVDAQVHVWERNHPGRPWRAEYQAVLDQIQQLSETASRRTELTGAQMIGEMAEAGVTAAIVVLSSLQYGFDCSYAFETAAAYPDRFAVVGSVDPARPDLDDYVAGWRGMPNGLGLRIVTVNPGAQDRLAAGGYDRLLSAAQKNEVPVCVYAPGRPDLIEAMARHYPDLQIVVDHVGLPVVPVSDPLKQAQALLRLGAFENLACKLSGLPANSKEAFPFHDLEPLVTQALDAFGPDRLMWGSDWTRINSVTYREGVDFMRDSALSNADKGALLGGSLRRIFRWPAAQRDGS
jgi:predicted TIM-barrel fold metal-dependent hydrolase